MFNHVQKKNKEINIYAQKCSDNVQKMLKTGSKHVQQLFKHIENMFNNVHKMSRKS